MSNPEFKRNLWLSFSKHRLIAMPALLALTLFAVSLSEQHDVADRLFTASILLFIFVVWLWGARNANDTIVDELRDKTWDQQRMSALTPWTMTWGKLFGSTSFNWYGGMMCLIVVAASGISAGKQDVIATIFSLCATGVLLHAALIALNLHTSQIEARIIQRGGVGWVAIIIAISFGSFMFSADFSAQTSWWNTDWKHAYFWLVSALLFAACATFAAWRVTCNALQVRTLPWAWPALACLLTFYFAGFINQTDGIQTLFVVGLMTSVTLSYAALVSEPNTVLLWRKLRLLQSKDDWRGWLENLPLWPTTLLLSFIFATLIQLTSLGSHAEQLGIDNVQNTFTLPLMLLRDSCILLFFAFAPNNKRALGSTLLYLLVLDLLLPFLAEVAGLELVRYLLLPFDTKHAPWSSILIMASHTAIAISLVNWRLQKVKLS
jgi:hypothetical protein